jgi:hypothetical protein
LKIATLTIAISLCSFLWGQTPTVNVQSSGGVVITKEKKPFYYIENQEVKQIDTASLDNVEDFGMEDFVLNLGNDGSPQFSLMPNRENLITNDYSVLSYQPTHKFRRYKVYKPIVDAKYVIGTGQEQHFSVLHSQNIREKVNYTIGLNKINSNGIYQNQETNYTDIFFNSYGEDLWNGKYDYDLEFNYLNAAASLNGGLENDSSFTHDTLDLGSKELLDINLLYAYQETKKWYGNFSQQFRIFSSVDSTGKGTEVKLINRLEYEHNSRLFYDSLLNTDFYDRILLDSSVTNETLTYQRLNGFLGIGTTINNKTLHYFRVGVDAAYIDYRQMALDTFRYDLEAKAEAVLNFDVIIIPKVSYLINDAYANNDYNIDVDLYYWWGKYAFEGKAYVSNERPQLDLLQYAGNNVSWNNSFDKYQLNHFMLSAERTGKWNAALAVNYFDIHNPIYFGYDKTPYQAPGVAQLIRTSLSTSNKDNDRWDLSGEAHYQYQGGYNVFRVPDVMAKVSAAFKFKAFKKKMDAAFGVDVTYFSKYETKHFDPVTGQFYIYSSDEVGNYPYANVFFKSRVQRATFFLMMSHPHQGLLGTNYFYFPGYPANDRFFRIGLSWLFTN